MNPDQATERSYPNQNSSEREQESKGKAHDCPMGYVRVMPNDVPHAAALLLRVD